MQTTCLHNSPIPLSSPCRWNWKCRLSEAFGKFQEKPSLPAANALLHYGWLPHFVHFQLAFSPRNLCAVFCPWGISYKLVAARRVAAAGESAQRFKISIKKLHCTLATVLHTLHLLVFCNLALHHLIPQGYTQRKGRLYPSQLWYEPLEEPPFVLG